ncbi:uncharacterized protein Sap-r isoform X2 [Panulirus ornatus]|uniref:uncharacterized protein Sap-r isoform X2 n=1 Tax=Panulirus ornatus TaxID=150431 RepID=UPI003A88D7AD
MRGLVFLSVLLAGFILSGESALLGSKKCTYGPSYWCDSLPNAKECSAVTHCIQSVWEKQHLPEDNDDICTLCKNMVKEARDQLLSNETQEEIREVFEGSCHLIPIKVLADECVHVADDFIPELIDTLASQMNPQVVCAAAGLCNSVRVDRLIQEYKESHPVESNVIVPSQPVHHPQPGDCESCKDFVTRTIRLVKTHSRAELMDRLLAVCGRLGSLSDGCMALVEANFENIYKFLTEELTPDNFCDLVEMCENRMHETAFYQRPALQHTGNEPCDFCVAIVKHWRDVLTANTTEEEFKQILDGLCHQTGKFSKNCLALVDEYYLPLYNLLIAEIHPKQICEAVGLCGLNSVFANEYPVWTLLDAQEPATLPLIPLEPSVLVDEQQGHRMTGDDEAAAIEFEQEQEELHLPRVRLTNGGINVSPVGTNGVLGGAVGKGRVGDDNKCVMCEFAIHFLQNILEQRDTREDIEEAVEKLCDLMPSSVADECEDYVEAYGDQVIELLAQEMDPTKICTMLHLCPAHTEVEESTHGEDVSCVMCEYAMTQLEEMLQDHKTEEDIRHALDNLCSLLPKSVEAECQIFVDTYTDQVIHMLINNLTPDEVCQKLGLCKPKDVELPRLNASHQLPISRMFVSVHHADASNNEVDTGVQQSAVCVLCEFAMNELDNLLLDNATVSEITEVVDFLCAHLPGTLQDDCIGFVEQYGDAIIKLLVHDLDPQYICQQMKLCKPPSYTGQRAMLNMKLDNCQVCKGVVSYIDGRLKDGDYTRTIENILEEVCRFFPKPAEIQCRSLIEVYGPYFPNLLSELGNPDKVCQGIHFCTSDSTEQLLGGEKCTWGPSYWCQTKMHAAACKATTHCETKVWKGIAPLV